MFRAMDVAARGTKELWVLENAAASSMEKMVLAAVLDHATRPMKDRQYLWLLMALCRWYEVAFT